MQAVVLSTDFRGAQVRQTGPYNPVLPGSTLGRSTSKYRRISIMNKLRKDKQIQAISALVEGSSIRSVERMTGVHRDTIMRLMRRVGFSCGDFMYDHLRGLTCPFVQVDEIWCFVGKKQRHVKAHEDQSRVGDFWTFVAIDAVTKLVPAFHVGKRDADSAHLFMWDLASRLEGRVQISSDKLAAYTEAIEMQFGSDVDYGRIVKRYEVEPAIGPGRYSPPHVVSTEKDVVFGDPRINLISTSYVERQNLTVRMSMRRFTRLTNGFSKSVENLRAAVALHFAHYNYVRKHRTLGTTPAHFHGVADREWTIGDLIELAN